jgi:hypothetical protein
VLPYSITVTSTLTVDPSNPYFDLLSASGRRVELIAKSTQSDFRVLGVDVLDGPFQASFLGAPGRPYRIAVMFQSARPGRAARHARAPEAAQQRPH